MSLRIRSAHTRRSAVVQRYAVGLILPLVLATDVAVAQTCVNYQNHLRGVGRVLAPGETKDITIAGPHAYLASRWWGLQVIDISNPTSPTHIGGVEVYGVFSILLFFTLFALTLLWVFRMKRPHLDAMSRLPLQDGRNDSSNPPSFNSSQPNSRHE